MKVRISNLPVRTEKIACIKLIRLVSGMGLKDSKDLVESSEVIASQSVEVESLRMLPYQIERNIKADPYLAKLNAKVEEVVEPVDPAKVPAVEQIESEGTQLFNVPNDADGLAFLDLCKRYLNKHRFSGLRKKGRGKNRPRRVPNDLRVAESEWFAVYPNESEKYRKAEYKRMREQWNAQEKSRKEQEDNLRKRIRQEIAMEQLNSGIILPEVIQLVRQQVRKEVLEEVGQKLRVRQVRLDMGDDIAIEVTPAT